MDENGVVTGVSEGYAYLLAYVDVGVSLETTCIVKVVPCVHEHTTVTTTEATCEADGAIREICDHCGAVVSETILPGGHDYDVMVTAPTCTTDGCTTYTCINCGHSYVDDVVPAPGHSFETLTQAPDCQGPGYTQHVCTTCGYVYIDDIQDALPCAAFEDVPLGKWYHDAVDYVVSRGLMNGISATHFDPEGLSTRAHVVTVLYRMAGSPAVEGELPFVDVEPDAWYHDAVLWAVSSGITNGIDDTHFAPDASVTRAQLITFLYRYADPENVDLSALEQFPDGADLPAFCRESFAWGIETGLIAGMDGALNANGTATRAQLATVLMRFDQYLQ